MASRTQDLLGKLIDTALEQADDDLDFDATGTTGLIVPKDADISDDTEEDDAFEALREELSPGEAEEVVETMRPLSKGERQILEETPGLKGLTRVDDAEHEDWMIDNSLRAYKGLDPILDDAIYGEDMNHNEEQMESLGLDSDSGFGFKSLRRGISKGIRKAGSSAYKYSGAKMVANQASKIALIPVKKSIRKFTNKIVSRRANYLAKQQGLSSPTPEIQAQAKAWSKDYVRTHNSKFGSVIASLMGNEHLLDSALTTSMGMSGKTLALIALGPIGLLMVLSKLLTSSSSEGAPPVEGQEDQSLDPNADPENLQEVGPAADATPDQNADSQSPSTDAAQGDDMTTGIDGDDSLGAFATEILSGAAPSKPQANAQARQFLNLMLYKLRNGKPLSPQEVGRIATLSKQGDPVAAKMYPILLKQGAAVSGDDSGAWAHMLNPLYWLKSSDERKFTDIEKDKWNENARLQKDLKRRKDALEQAERAKTAAEAVTQAKAQAASTEAQLKEIETSLKGELLRDLNADVNGTFVGHEKPTAVTKVLLNALDKSGKRANAKALYDKISQGQALTPSELTEARSIARLLHKIKVVHGDLMSGDSEPTSVLHGAFVGACVLGNIQTARARNAQIAKAADHLSNRIASGSPLSQVEKKATAKVLTETQKLRNFTKSHVTGSAFVGHANTSKLRRSTFIGAAKIMSESDKKMLASIVKLAKSGNPRAVKALAALKKSGEIMGGDFVGSFLSKAFNYATMPITVPAKGVWAATKWTGRQLGITKGGHTATPEEVRLAKLRAARQRTIAAQAKARAADAQTEAELRSQEAIASAADAEAQAADAEALAKEAAMRTAEIEANPDMATSQTDEDSSGEFIGSWTSMIGKNTKSAKIVAKASEKSATGMKIRAGAKMAAKIKAGDPKSKAALKTMIAKSNKGDAQAKRDLNAIYAGYHANAAKQLAKKKQAAVLAGKARKLKVIAAQRKLEARVATKLARTERKVQISHFAKVEAKAARGNKKANAYVAQQVIAAKKGDKKAQTRVAAMKLGRRVRLAAPTKRERRNLAVAAKVVERAQKNDPKALRQIAIHKAAAKQGNPNAQRAMKRYEIMAPVVAAVTTGVIVGAKSKKKKDKARKDQIAAVTKAKKDLAAKKGTREEYAAGARAAQALGDKETAGLLAVAASQAPSSTERLKKTATVVAAKEAGNVEAQEAIAKNFAEAKAGNPEAIEKTANVVAVQTIDDINKGKAVSPAMRDAINLHERIAAGDPAAMEQAKLITAEATKPNPIPEATAAAVTLAAAAVTANALASKPKAKEEFLAKVNPPLSTAEKGSAEAEIGVLLAKAKNGTITPEEGERGIRLAERLGKPNIAAQISSMAPPMDYSHPLSTLPDMPLAPITNSWDLIKESLRALSFSTRDPLGNYRGGIAARSKAVAATAPVSTSGWSPFAYFKKMSPWIAPVASSAAAAASFANLFSNKSKKSNPTPTTATPAAAPSVAPTAAPASAPATATAAPTSVETVSQSPSEAALSAKPTTSQGESPTETASFQDKLVELLNKSNAGTLSEEDRQLAIKIANHMKLPLVVKKLSEIKTPVTSQGNESVDPEGLAEIDHRLATEKKHRRTRTVVAQTSSGSDKKTFKEYVTEAIKSQKMSKDDFNKMIEVHLGPKTTKENKVASGEKILKFLASKGVKVEA
jgi:hypothetical protein